MNWLGRKVAGEVVRKADFVLDIGCGIGVTTAAGIRDVMILPERVSTRLEINRQKLGFFGRAYLGIDCFRPQLDVAKQAFPVMVGKAPGVLHSFLDRSWDVVLLLDVIEHLEKEDAVKTIREAQRISKRSVVIYTPRGFVEKPGLDWHGTGWNEGQKHACGFEVDELEELGFFCQLSGEDPMEGRVEGDGRVAPSQATPGGETVESIYAIWSVR